jgi:tetratricopeptide (TPR) repeat protein
LQSNIAGSKIKTMHTPKLQCLLSTASIVLLLSCAALSSQTVPAKTKKQPNPVEEAKTRREAMDLFKKAEAMIGTAGENSEEQAELFRKAIQAKPDFLEAHYNLGLIYANQKKMAEASAEFETVLQIEPQFDAEIYLLLATTHQARANNGAAIAALEEGLRRKPNDLKFLKALAYMQYNDKKDSSAIQTLIQLLEVDPADASAHIDLALLYLRNNQAEKAISHFQEALLRDANNFEARYNLGLLYLRQKKHGEATIELEMADKIRPGDPDLLERLGDAYAYQNQHDKAVVAYRAALIKASDRGSVLAKLGFNLANLNRTEEAVATLESANKLNDRNSDVLFLLGDLYGDLKRYEDAIAAYQKSIRINPKQKEVHYNLGTVFAEQNRLNDAMTELKIALDLDPQYAAAWSNMALVAEKMDRDREAIQAHEKVIALGNGRGLNYFHLGVLYAKVSLPDASIAAFTRAIEMEPEKYRAVLKEELKKVHSVLDSVRYKEGFAKLINPSSAN